MKYESRQELANVIAFEGGLESFLRKGFHWHEIPEEDEGLRDFAVDLKAAWLEYRECAEVFMGALPKPEDVW